MTPIFAVTDTPTFSTTATQITPTSAPIIPLPSISPTLIEDNSVVATPTAPLTSSLALTAMVGMTDATGQLYLPLLAVDQSAALTDAAPDEVTPAAPLTGTEAVTLTPTLTVDPLVAALLTQSAAMENHPTLYVADEALLTTEELTFTSMVSRSGGVITAFDDRLEVRFAAESAPESLVVTVRPASNKAAAPTSLSRWPFEIIATGTASGAEVHQFKRPLEIVLHYEETWLQGDEESLALFYYNDKEQSWLPLPSRVDAENNLLIAHTDHLTIFDFDIQNWEAARLPGLDGFQVGEFTGAAQYRYAFVLPPGPGGWQPQLSLTYNSQVVDSATNRTQAEWVGMGWSLETGYIERAMRGSNTLDDDVFVLMLNGASYRLLPDGNGQWRTEEDAFLRVQYNGNPNAYGDQDQYWTVWDKEGNQYLLGGPETHRATFPRNADKWTWRWSLRVARNQFGQEISYNYAYEGVQKNCGETQASAGGNDVAVYPAEILYPNGKYRIQFDRTSRSDFEGGWLDPCASVRFQRSLLSQIRVEHFNGSGWELVRRYLFTYDFNTIFPGVSWQAGGRTPTLTQVQEFGADHSPLPATTFAYGDAMHLTRADNGYKGRVEFSYTL